jgi:hypothetical protein
MMNLTKETAELKMIEHMLIEQKKVYCRGAES